MEKNEHKRNTDEHIDDRQVLELLLTSATPKNQQVTPSLLGRLI